MNDPASSQEFNNPTGALAELMEFAPRFGIVAGSGLGRLVELVDIVGEVGFSGIPGVPASSVSGHAGSVVWGHLSGLPVMLALGRVHFYEGHDARTTTTMVRCMAACGVDRLLLTNAAGSLHPEFQPGQWMLLQDHINLTGVSPLHGPQFVDMTQAYDPDMRTAFSNSASSLGMRLNRGIYACLRGPQYETPAEIGMLKTIGAHAVGMSTVLETIQARALGVRVAALSCLTNWAAGISGQPLSHDEVIETGGTAVNHGLALIECALTQFAAIR